MNKGIADQFLRSITDSKGDNNNQPRVVMVRSNHDTKRFITRALSEVENLVALLGNAPIIWSEVNAGCARLSTLCEEHRQHNIQLAAKDISELAAYLDSVVGSCSALQDAEELKSNFGDLVTYLSTMLLRVYIEGSDAACMMELSNLETLLSQTTQWARNQRFRGVWIN